MASTWNAFAFILLIWRASAVHYPTQSGTTSIDKAVGKNLFEIGTEVKEPSPWFQGLGGCNSGNFSSKGPLQCTGIKLLQCDTKGECEGSLQGQIYKINCNHLHECVTDSWGATLVKKSFSTIDHEGNVRWSNGCSWICEDKQINLMKNDATVNPGFFGWLDAVLSQECGGCVPSGKECKKTTGEDCLKLASGTRCKECGVCDSKTECSEYIPMANNKPSLSKQIDTIPEDKPAEQCGLLAVGRTVGSRLCTCGATKCTAFQLCKDNETCSDTDRRDNNIEYTNLEDDAAMFTVGMFYGVTEIREATCPKLHELIVNYVDDTSIWTNEEGSINKVTEPGVNGGKPLDKFVPVGGKVSDLYFARMDDAPENSVRLVNGDFLKTVKKAPKTVEEFNTELTTLRQGLREELVKRKLHPYPKTSLSIPQVKVTYTESNCAFLFQVITDSQYVLRDFSMFELVALTTVANSKEKRLNARGVEQPAEKNVPDISRKLYNLVKYGAPVEQAAPSFMFTLGKGRGSGIERADASFTGGVSDYYGRIAYNDFYAFKMARIQGGCLDTATSCKDCVDKEGNTNCIGNKAAKEMFHRAECDVKNPINPSCSFNKCQNTYVAGVSGTILEQLTYAHAKGVEVDGAFAMVLMAALIINGHHSLPETFITTKKFFAEANIRSCFDNINTPMDLLLGCVDGKDTEKEFLNEYHDKCMNQMI